ncbi:hypothetical protein EUA76_02395 [TM7 phylum sp. oral taxon 350]|nr:hypothetical protein EUA76_02395 [TM7 phylum sp. oral taxon 350]
MASSWVYRFNCHTSYLASRWRTTKDCCTRYCTSWNCNRFR